MIRLLVDSSADFSKAEIEEKKLLFVPLQVTIEDKNYLDGIDIFTNEFYEKMIATDGFFKTSQPSPQQFLDHFQKAKENNDTLICVLISSALSGTIQSAILAKNIVEYDNIYIVDALTTTVGIRVMIDKAIEMIKEGKEAKEIVTYLEEMRSHIKILAAVDTLEYLCKGGRCSKGVYLMGSLLKIKPILQIHGEKLDTFKKTRTIENAKRIMIDQAKTDIANFLSFDGKTDNIHIDVAYTKDDTDAQKFAQEIATEFGKNDIIVNPLSLSVSCHIGPGALAIAATKDTLED